MEYCLILVKSDSLATCVRNDAMELGYWRQQYGTAVHSSIVPSGSPIRRDMNILRPEISLLRGHEDTGEHVQDMDNFQRHNPSETRLSTSAKWTNLYGCRDLGLTRLTKKIT